MIAKSYEVSLVSYALETLYKRLPRDHPKFAKIKEEYYQKVYGDYGEEAVMKVMEQLKLPYKFYVFHDISLYGDSLFQMDVFMITPYYVLIFEVKNISGELLFTDQQLQRTRGNDMSQSFDNPFLQLAEYEYQLQHVLKSLGISLPIFSAVVFPFPTSQLKNPPVNKTVLFRRGIKPYIRNISIDSPILKTSELDSLKTYLIKENKPFLPFPLSDYYNINPEVIKKGVECKNCGFIGMKKILRNWYCPKCRFTDKHAHIETLKQYFFIMKSTITNKECQQFLILNNKHEATKILKNPSLIKLGNTARSRKYKIILPQ